jgi:hypothetical protein
VRIVLQNMTSGGTTPAMRNAHVVLASEVHRGRFHSGFPDHFDTFTPSKRVPRLGIAWDTRRVKDVSTHALRFHDSGRAEGWPFRTPPRGLAWIKAEVNGDPWVFWVTWLLNSWNPMNPDQHTAARRRVVTTLELPVVREKVREWDRRGFAQAGGGDMNSLKAPLPLHPLVQVHDEGLDRAYVSQAVARGRRPVRTTRTRTTGVGRQMRHHGIGLWVPA